MNNEELLQISLESAVNAGNLLAEHSNDFLKISKKESLRDIVTEVDKLSEETIMEVIKKYDPNSTIVTEESGTLSGTNTHPR